MQAAPLPVREQAVVEPFPVRELQDPVPRGEGLSDAVGRVAQVAGVRRSAEAAQRVQQLIADVVGLGHGPLVQPVVVAEL